MKLKIIVGSNNPLKITATQDAFERIFEKQKIEIIPMKVESGISNMPLSDQEMIAGAKNRAIAALYNLKPSIAWDYSLKGENLAEIANVITDIDFSVGIEGGIHVAHEIGFLRAWIAVFSLEQSSFGLASTIAINVPTIVLRKVLAGKELKYVIDDLTGLKDTNKKTGAFGHLTKGIITRKDTFITAIIAATAKFYNNSFFET